MPGRCDIIENKSQFLEGGARSCAPDPAPAAPCMPVRQQIENLYTDHHGWLLAWLRRRVGCGHRAADLA
ncbi:hypothetical protein BER2_4156 [plant metagenome]|uniref:Uncharacterized protein n=1 Tax=plant metagenome TaxID=1297885 RepID=A0A484R697_9ZZZZ